MSFKINFLFPSCQRPNKFFSTLDNLKEMCLTENYEVTAILEKTDASMNNPVVLERISQYLYVKPFFINSTGKIDAINSGLKYLSPDYDILVLIADDIVFTVKGFDYIIIEDMRKHFPKLDGLLHYPDNIPQSGERQITMPVMGKNLIGRFGYIYHPSYISVWADTEQIAVVKKINKYKLIRMNLYEHNHFVWGKCSIDDLYKKNESFYQIDSVNYFKRSAINFDL